MTWHNTTITDPKTEPLFLKFSRTFKNNNLFRLNQEIEEFEKKHPRLKLFLVENINREISVNGDYLFSDGQKDYYELKYKYIKYGRVLYYEPDPELAQWLAMIDEFKESCKKKRTKRSPQRIKQAELIRYPS